MRKNFSALALAAVSLVCILILTGCNNGGAGKLRYITITPTTASIDVGTTQQFSATGYFSDGTTTPNFPVVWGSSNMAVATITTGGVASAVGPGTTSITATANGITATPATLNSAQLTAINLTPANKTINVTQTQAFTATGTFKNPDGTTGTADITSQITTWLSGTPAVATIDNTGLATAVAAGTTMISATLNGVTGNTNLIVSGTPVALSLVVSPATPTVAVGNALTFTVKEKWSDGTLHNPSGAVTWMSDTPATATILGTSGISAAHATGTATITATEGTLTPGNTLLTVVKGSTHYAYVSNIGDSTVSEYSVDITKSPALTSTGTLTNAGLTTNPTFEQTVLHPSGLYMYAITEAGANSDVYVFNLTAGVPGTPSGPQLAGSGSSNYGAVDPYGQFLYVTDSGTNAVYGFTISPTDGSLTAMAGSPFTGAAYNLNSPQYVTVDPSGQYAFVVNQGNNTVSAYSITPTTGVLTVLAGTPTIATGSTPQYATLDPTGKYFYVANTGDNTVSAYTVTAGVLAQIGASNFSIPTATEVFNVAVDPSGKYLYVLDTGNTTTIAGQVYSYNLTAGAIGTANGSPAATGLGPIGIAVDPTGAFIGVDNNFDGPPGTISLIGIGANGVVSDLSPKTVNAGNAPQFVTFYNAP